MTYFILFFMDEKFVSFAFSLHRELVESLLFLMVTIQQLGCLRSLHQLLRRELVKTLQTCTEIPRISGDVLWSMLATSCWFFCVLGCFWHLFSFLIRKTEFLNLLVAGRSKLPLRVSVFHLLALSHCIFLPCIHKMPWPNSGLAFGNKILCIGGVQSTMLSRYYLVQ